MIDIETEGFPDWDNLPMAASMASILLKPTFVTPKEMLENKIEELRNKLDHAQKTRTAFEHLDMMLLNQYEIELYGIQTKFK